MPSSPKIPKQTILNAALELLIENGYSNLNIKTLAEKLQCSTQPISWHFGNMEGLRKSLTYFALEYANEKMRPKSQNAFQAFTEVGSAYVNLAFDEPELFKYLYCDGSGYCLGSVDMIASVSENKELADGIADFFKISEDKAQEYLQNCVIYSHGILSYVVFGILKSNRECVKKMINSAGYAFLAQAEADVDKAKTLASQLLGEDK